MFITVTQSQNMLTIRKERRTAMRHLVNKCSRRIICRMPQKREEGGTKFLLCHPQMSFFERLTRLKSRFPYAGQAAGYLPSAEASIFLATIASMTATAVMFTMSRTELSMSVKWTGLFSPIWIGPIISASLMACISL